MTLLAWDIVEATLDGRQPEQMTLAGLMKPFPIVWTEQQMALLRELALLGKVSDA